MATKKATGCYAEKRIEIFCMMLSLIVAYDKNRVIGFRNQLPWRLPADLVYFKKNTMSKVIVMGRKTHESIGKPLPGRRNIVISEEKKFSGCEAFKSLSDALFALQSEREIMVIGGESLYWQCLPMADRIYATEIDAAYEGDAYFPVIEAADWKIISSEKHARDTKNPHGYNFVVYERRA